MGALRPLGLILTPVQAGLYGDAETALAQAVAQAASMLADAAHAIEAERLDVVQRAEAAAQHRAAEILAQAAAAARGQLAALRPDVARAVGLAVARVVGALPLSEAVAAAAQHALQELAAQHGVTVHVHAANAAGVRQALAGWGDSLRVVADDTLKPDACTIETPAGIVRAGLGEQLAVLQAALDRC